MIDHAEKLAVLDDLLRWRRDVRHFRTDPVCQDKLDRLRVAMDLSPSVGNARPWRVLRIEDRDLRGQVRAVFDRCNAAAAAGYADKDRTDYLGLKLAGLDRAPIQLAVFTDVDPEAGRGLGRQTMPETLAQSTAMAVHSLWLMARALGLGVGMLSILDPEEMAAIFGVPPSWRFFSYLCIGYPEIEDDTPLLHRKGWQANTPNPWMIR